MSSIIWTATSGAIEEIAFDTLIEEDPSAEAELTSHPIEDGSTVSDHVILAPMHLSISARVSNTPIRLPRTQNRGATGAVSPMDLQGVTRTEFTRKASENEAAQLTRTQVQASAQVLQFSAPMDRVRDVHSALLDLRASRVPVSVVTSIRQYDSMILLKVGAPRSAEDGDGITFALEFGELIVVTTRLVDAPTPSQDRGHRARDRGQQSTTTPTDTSGRRTSMARQIWDSFQGAHQ